VATLGRSRHESGYGRRETLIDDCWAYLRFAGPVRRGDAFRQQCPSLRNHQNLAQRTGLRGVMTWAPASSSLPAASISPWIGRWPGRSRSGAPSRTSCVSLGGRRAVLPAPPLIGLFHGLLITKLRLQALYRDALRLFIYRGIACWPPGLHWRLGAHCRGIGGVQRARVADRNRG